MEVLIDFGAISWPFLTVVLLALGYAPFNQTGGREGLSEWCENFLNHN